MPIIYRYIHNQAYVNKVKQTMWNILSKTIPIFWNLDHKPRRCSMRYCLLEFVDISVPQGLGPTRRFSWNKAKFENVWMGKVNQ